MVLLLSLIIICESSDNNNGSVSPIGLAVAILPAIVAMLLVALEDLTKVRACYASDLVNITWQVYISDVTSATGICHLIFGGGNKTLEGAATACSPYGHGYERREERYVQDNLSV